MNLVTLENINKSYSEKILLKDVSLGINSGDKVGIIGINGAGKSTFLKILAGKDEFFDGTLIKGKNIRIEYLSQNPEISNESTVIEQIFKGDTKEMKILRDYECILNLINTQNTTEDLNFKLLKLQDEIDSLNIWDMESEAKIILNKLGIDNYYEKMKNLSGGQKKRVALASSLISQCELLILDEPTNHLDSDSIEWLENYLNNRKGALVMITHDRYFLDRVSNKIIELDRGKAYSYEGNYSVYLEKKIERIAIEEAQEEKRKALIKKELKWVKRGAKARTTKQKARLDRFEELKNTEYISQNTDINLSFQGRRLGKKIIEISNINKSYNNNVLINDFSYICTKYDRIGIIGNNGVGKTTLINIIQGNVKQDSGNIEIGETVKIGCFSQDDRNMDPNMRVIDYVKEGGEIIPVSDGSKITASMMCERFLFDGSMQYTKIEKLSGGERRRLHLLRVLMESPNVLLLDEPTNDLDITTLNILEDYLDSFIGVVITVSHDRYFLDRICNKIFSYEDNGRIKIYNGNYSDYMLSKGSKASELNSYSINEKKESKSSTRVRERDLRPKFSFKEAKEYEEINDVIISLESKISTLEKQMEENASSYSKLEELMQEKDELEEELLYKYERYEYLDDLATKIKEYKNQN